MTDRKENLSGSYADDEVAIIGNGPKARSLTAEKGKWRDMQETSNAAGLISCIPEHIDYAGTMIWPCPIPQDEFMRMKKAGAWITVFFVLAYIVLAVLS